MSRWFAGPTERRIQPPMKNAVTVYHRTGNVIVYITESPFLKATPSHDVRQLAAELVNRLNQLEERDGKEGTTDCNKNEAGDEYSSNLS